MSGGGILLGCLTVVSGPADSLPEVIYLIFWFTWLVPVPLTTIVCTSGPIQLAGSSLTCSSNCCGLYLSIGSPKSTIVWGRNAHKNIMDAHWSQA